MVTTLTYTYVYMIYDRCTTRSKIIDCREGTPLLLVYHGRRLCIYGVGDLSRSPEIEGDVPWSCYGSVSEPEVR